MKKLFSVLLAATLCIGVGWAADETVTFSAQGYTNGQEITTVNGTNFTITFNKGTNSNEPKSIKEVEEAISPLEKAHLSKSWLSTVVGGVKSFVTRYANINGIAFSWQKRFHDHIIRGNADYNLISNYIDNNVENWNIDCFNE